MSTARRTAPVAPAVLAAVLAAGCQTSWVMDDARQETVETQVVIRSEPTGAMIRFNGRKQDAAPIRIPVRYTHQTEQWARSSNYGASIRESTGIVGTLLLIPVWLPASFVQFRDQMKRHTYGGNEHVVLGTFADGSESERTVKLEGEAEVTVTLTPPR